MMTEKDIYDEGMSFRLKTLGKLVDEYGLRKYIKDDYTDEVSGEFDLMKEDELMPQLGFLIGSYVAMTELRCKVDEALKMRKELL